MTKFDWIQVQNSSLYDTFVEIASSFNVSRYPVVILRKSDSSYVKLTETDMWWDLNLNSLNKRKYHKKGRWQLSNSKAGTTNFFYLTHLKISYIFAFFIKKTALNSSKWLFYANKKISYFEKISDKNWIEVQNNSLVATFTEVSNKFDIYGNKPEVVLKRGKIFFKLIEGEAWSGQAANNLSNFKNMGRWILPTESKKSLTQKYY